MSPQLGTAGQPTEDQFKAIKRAGYQVVINLALVDSPLAIPNECQLVEQLGMEYIHIPVRFEAPAPEQVEKFFRAMSRHKEDNVFVHCVANKRVSAFVYLYRVLCQSANEEAAARDRDRVWEPDENWRAFMAHFVLSYTRITNAGAVSGVD